MKLHLCSSLKYISVGENFYILSLSVVNPLAHACFKHRSTHFLDLVVLQYIVKQQFMNLLFVLHFSLLLSYSPFPNIPLVPFRQTPISLYSSQTLTYNYSV